MGFNAFFAIRRVKARVRAFATDMIYERMVLLLTVVREVQEIIQPPDSAVVQTRAGLQDTFVLLATMGLLGLGGAL